MATRKTGSISVITPTPSFGEYIEVKTTAEGFIPWAHLLVYKDGTKVAEAYDRADANGVCNFTLGPTPSWSGGAADGRVELVYWVVSRQTFGKPVAALDFQISA